MRSVRFRFGVAFILALAAAGPVGAAEPVGDAIVICGQRFSTGTPVVLWTDPPHYDAYSTLPRFAPADKQPPEKKKPRYGSRASRLEAAEATRVQTQGWDLPTLQKVVDQFVIHFDVCGTSKRCFQVLQDDRGLSVHFMLDLDGTIYQTLDLKESAWHATKSNSRSVGIEIANMGAYAPGGRDPLARWYEKGPDGKTRITIADPFGKDSQRRKDLILRPFHDEPVVGRIRGETLRQFDFTPEQYEALTRLTAALCKAFPKLKCDYPRTPDGKARLDTLSNEEWETYQGVLGHYHVQTNKTDPGPAFQWDRVIGGAQKLLGSSR